MSVTSLSISRREVQRELLVWPRLMRSDTAAAYVDERSVGAFLRGVGKIWPRGIAIAGKGRRWLRDDLDRAIERLSMRAPAVEDAADLL